MRIDDFMPEYDFKERHGIEIAATSDEVFRVLHSVDFCESGVIRWLFRLRGLGSQEITLAKLRAYRFETLAIEEGREMVLGLAGRFWLPNGDLQKVETETFYDFNRPGFAKAVWNFFAESVDGNTRLTTETRVKCLDQGSRRRFGIYWTVVGPFSGIIRSEMLKTIKRKAESR